jgi:hypothetical protein
MLVNGIANQLWKLIFFNFSTHFNFELKKTVFLGQN